MGQELSVSIVFAAAVGRAEVESGKKLRSGLDVWLSLFIQSYKSARSVKIENNTLNRERLRNRMVQSMYPASRSIEVQLSHWRESLD